jgi:membrane associated rhomboid family serine protease
MVRAIILLNVIVFIAWFAASTESNLEFMMNHFTISWDGLVNGRFWTLLTSVFSHNYFWHLLINMYVLYGFGYVLNRLLGPRRFLIFYLIAGISGSLMHALVSEYYLHSPELPALGASGAIAGIIIFFALTFPKEKLLLLGFIPVGARWAAIMLVALDLWGLSAQSKGGGLPIGHGAHLGGAFVGILYYFFPKNRGRLTL